MNDNSAVSDLDKFGLLSVAAAANKPEAKAAEEAAEAAEAAPEQDNDNSTSLPPDIIVCIYINVPPPAGCFFVCSVYVYLLICLCIVCCVLCIVSLLFCCLWRRLCGGRS